MTYRLRAYKPSGTDYCRGCLMASWSSDYESVDVATEEEILDKIIELKSRPLEDYEPEWQFEVFHGYGEVFSQFEDRVDARVAELRLSAERAAAAAAEQAAQAAAAAKERSERATYERLRVKYEH